ncbi:hypothetical protein FQN57_006287 [Myotisia sp. PD_48]|nr:hypothetical protein FQN57_006287 [Myotisia sp. PD_48]
MAASAFAATTSLPPSPTESTGCEPHGDHWHCSGTAIPPTESASISSSHDHDHGHEQETMTPTIPSPTNSVGCEPHGDHWHCDGPRETSPSSTADDHAAATIPPSPTQSVGCEPHGDHWHCEGPRETGTGTVTTTATGAESGTGTVSGIPESTGAAARDFQSKISLVVGITAGLAMALCAA